MATKPTRKNALLPFKYGDIRDRMCALFRNKMFSTSGTESADEPAARRRRHSTKILCRRLLIWTRHAGGGDTATRSDCAILGSAKLRLRKLCANHPDLLKDIPRDQALDLDFS